MSIKIDLIILLFILLFCFTSQIEMYVMLLFFALIHELGHLCVGLILGFKLQELNITPMGMRIQFKPQTEEYNNRVKNGNILCVKRAIVAIAGPITNFIIILIMLLFLNLNKEFINLKICSTIIYSNFLIGIFNLIPIYPLDGGRILKEILHILFGIKKSYQYTYKIAKISIIFLTIISSIAILYIQNISIIIIIVYLWGIMLMQNRQ